MNTFTRLHIALLTTIVMLVAACGAAAAVGHPIEPSRPRSMPPSPAASGSSTTSPVRPRRARSPDVPAGGRRTLDAGRRQFRPTWSMR